MVHQREHTASYSTTHIITWRPEYDHRVEVSAVCDAVCDAACGAACDDVCDIFGGGDCGAGRRRDEEGQPPTGIPRS